MEAVYHDGSFTANSRSGVPAVASKMAARFTDGGWSYPRLVVNMNDSSHIARTGLNWQPHYPVGLLVAFALAMLMFVAAAACGALAVASSQEGWADVALAALAIGGALGYGCISRTEEIDGPQDLSA